jgi:hypothetical protein
MPERNPGRRDGAAGLDGLSPRLRPEKTRPEGSRAPSEGLPPDVASPPPQANIWRDRLRSKPRDHA